MKYIGNAFSANMVQNKIVQIKNITKEEFVKARKSAISICGHPEIAKQFQIELNRESITLETNDVLYIVLPATRPHAGQRVEDGARYRFIPEEEGYIYKKITIGGAI